MAICPVQTTYAGDQEAGEYFQGHSISFLILCITHCKRTQVWALKALQCQVEMTRWCFPTRSE